MAQGIVKRLSLSGFLRGGREDLNKLQLVELTFLLEQFLYVVISWGKGFPNEIVGVRGVDGLRGKRRHK